MTKFISLMAVLFTFGGCSTLIGNVKPVDQKSDHYSVVDLSSSHEWKKLDSAISGGEDGGSESTDQTDVTYQSRRTAAIISLNTVCRGGKKASNNLELISRELLLGITSVTTKEQKNLTISGEKALETTVEGQISGEHTKIRAVVLTHDSCVFDLMYVTRPDQFQVHEADFARFISSLQLR